MVEALSSSKPKQFAKTGLVKKVVLALCAMCAEPDPEDYDEDSDDLPSNKVASQVLTIFDAVPDVCSMSSLPNLQCKVFGTPSGGFVVHSWVKQLKRHHSLSHELILPGL